MVHRHFPTRTNSNKSFFKMLSFFSILNTLYFCFMFTSIHGAIFSVENNCPYMVWAVAVPGISGKLEQGETLTFSQKSEGSGRIWARTNCNFNDLGIGKCESGDCDGLLNCLTSSAPQAPVTLAICVRPFQWN